MPNKLLLSLGAELAREQDRALVGNYLSEFDLLRHVGRSRMRTVARYRHLLWGGLMLACIATAVITSVVWRYPVLNYQVVGEGHAATRNEEFGRWVVAPADEPKVAMFSDGSEVRLEPGSRIRLAQASRWDIAITLESGSVVLEAAGQRFHDYLVGVGPFSLALTKARVQVSWDPMNELLDLVVHDGYVVISGCQFGTGRSIVAGKELGTRCIGQQPT